MERVTPKLKKSKLPDCSPLLLSLDDAGLGTMEPAVGFEPTTC